MHTLGHGAVRWRGTPSAVHDREYLHHAAAVFTAATGADVVATGDLPDGVAVAIDPDDHTVFIRADLCRDRYRRALHLAQRWIEQGPAAAPQFSTQQRQLRIVDSSPTACDSCARSA